METAEVLKVDKSGWAPGPWQQEPDRVDFVHAGFACFVRRHEELGHLCGYVGVPRSHAAYGKDYGEVDAEVHGGLSYASKCAGVICHVPAPGMPDDVWWFGFDAGNFMDLSPGLRAQLRDLGMNREVSDVYRDFPYMRAQTEQLAEQLAALKQLDS